MRHRNADRAAALDVDLQVAFLNDIVEVGDHEDLSEVVAELFELLDQLLAALKVLASEDLVEDDEAGFGAALTGDCAREGDAEGEVSEVLLATREATERMERAVVVELKRAGVVEPRLAVAAASERRH